MKNKGFKILLTYLISLLAGVIITSVLFLSGVIKVNYEEIYDYHLSAVPKSIDKTINILTDESDKVVACEAALTYKVNISDNLKEMARNAEVVVKGKFVSSGSNLSYTLPIEYIGDVSRIPIAARMNFKVDEVLKGSMFFPNGIVASIEMKEYERIMIEVGDGVNHYADVKDPLFIEPVMGNEYILFLDVKEQMGDNALCTLSEPVYVNLSGGKAELLCNIKEYSGLMEEECITNNGAKFNVNFIGTKINLKDDITGKSLDEIRVIVR